MGKLLDKLEKASRGVAQPLGFGGAARRERIAPMLLLGALRVGDDAQAKLAAEAELDAVVITVLDPSQKGDAAKSAKAFGDTVFGVWYEQAQAEDVEGSDFQVFSSDATPLAALSGEDRTDIMHVSPEMDDGLLRAVERIPVDAFLVSLADAESLTVAQLMRLARVRSVTSRWLLVHLRSLPSKDEMQHLRDAGVGAILVDLAGQTVDALKASRQTLLELPRETPDRNRGRTYATLPAVNDARQNQPSPAPPPDEDDWDDE